MPRTLDPIPVDVPIVEKDGSITIYFRRLWDTLIAGYQNIGSRAAVALTGQTAAIVTTSAYTTLSSGLYRISWYMRKTVADGVSSSLTVTLGWSESGIALTEAGAALATDTTSAQQSGSKVVSADAASDITFAVAYASNTPNKMTYRIDVVVELIQ